MKIAILQPNYIPWKGVFDLINQVDVFVFYDDVQYTKKDWRNRNKIKTPNGEIWLSVPVLHKGKRYQNISDTKIDTSKNWQQKHYKSIEKSYQKAPYFNEYKYLLDDIYINNKWSNISELNVYSTKHIAKLLDIDVEWYLSSQLSCDGKKNGEKIINICKKLGCNYFINGPSSKSFMDQKLFNEASITLEYMAYNYKAYKQLYPPFNHKVTIFDVIFNCGVEKAKELIFR